MELNEIPFYSPSSASMSQQSQDPNEGQSVCPLCSHEVRMYFVNFSEKIEMCGNYECDYPFGYLPLKIMKEDGMQNVEGKSVRSKSTSSSLTTSLASSAGWYDVEKLCNIFGSDGIPGLDLDKIKRSKLLQKTEDDKRKEEIKKNVEQIREMTKSMNDMQKETKSIIKNKTWLQNLSYLQGLSGINLMKPEEMQKFNKKQPSLGGGELKIDIDKNSSSTIKIAINHQPDYNKK